MLGVALVIVAEATVEVIIGAVLVVILEAALATIAKAEAPRCGKGRRRGDREVIVAEIVDAGVCIAVTT